MQAKSTGTIEELSQSLAEVKHEYAQFKEKATRQIIELNNEVQSKAKEHYNLLIQLKEERKKCVDLYKSAGEKSSVAQENQRLQARIESKVRKKFLSITFQCKNGIGPTLHCIGQ